jgi:hypothetical protein
MGKLVCEINVGGNDVAKALTTGSSQVGTFVKTTPGIGKPFFYFNSIAVPPGKSINNIAVDFSTAPVVVDDAAANNAAAADCAANIDPASVISFL